MNLIETLRQENKALKSKLKSQEEEIASLKKLNAWYIEQLELRQKEKFDICSMNEEEDQISLFDFISEPIQNESTSKVSGNTNRRKKRGAKLKAITVKKVYHKLPEGEKVCEICGSVLTEMKKEVRKELKIIPAKVEIVEHVTYVYSCRRCDKQGTEGFIKKAQSPKALILKSMVSPSMMAYIINEKYNNGIPLFQQQQRFKRYGFEISRQNLSHWVIKGSDLLGPLISGMKRELYASDSIYANRITIDGICELGRKIAPCYMWNFRNPSSAKHPVIIYDYKPGKAGAFSKMFLEKWKGSYLYCNKYSGYGMQDGITLCGNLELAKRRFHDASISDRCIDDARRGENYIQQLYDIEKEADRKGYNDKERLALRIRKSKAVLEEFYSWMDDALKRTLPDSLLGRAITYVQNQKSFLASILKDGRIQLHNYLDEPPTKLSDIGQKHWQFANAPNGVAASSVLFSVIQTAIANVLKPMPYLEYIYEQIQRAKDVSIVDLLPWSEKIPDCCKN